MGNAIFRLTDGTETINLMTNAPDGFYLQEYAPILSGFKGGGVFQDSPLADNRRPVYTRRETVVQPVVVSAKAMSHDNMARMLQDLVRLLDKAKDYWVSDWQNEPVWIEAKTAKETNLRYALIYMWRAEDYPAPYQQPFTQPGGQPVAQELTLFLEHGQWLDVAPNVEGGASSEIIGAKYYTENNFVSGNVATTLTITDHASIQNLPNGTNGFTVEFWLRASGGTKTASAGVTITKQPTSSTGWEAALYSGDGLPSATSRMDVWKDTPADVATVANQTSYPDMISDFYDGEWHHIMVSFNKNAAGSGDVNRMWVDGVEFGYNAAIQWDATGGAYASDVGEDFVVFLTGMTVGSKYDIGWLRISNIQRETSSTFTPQPLCTPPDLDANTIVQYNMNTGSGTTLVNQTGTSATNGVLTSFGIIEWGVFSDSVCPPVLSLGAITPTAEEVFVANKFSQGVITNWHIGTGGANLIGGAWPATVFSGTTDTYVGSLDGVFNSIVIDISIIGTETTPTWQYWNGAWTTLTISNALSVILFEAGQVIISWKPPADWVAASPGGGLPSGYYVRQTANVGTIQHAGPNDPYTVTWPFIQIDADQLPGDIPTLARMLLRPVGSDGTNNASGAADKIIYGSRRLDRGAAFRSHINLSDVGNVSGITISLGSGTFASNTQAPTGRLVSYTATTNFLVTAGALLNGAISRDYAGRFRVFVRFAYDIGTANTLTWLFRIQYGSGGSFFDGRPVVIDDTFEGSTPLANAYLLEFGPIHIRPDLLVGTETDIAELAFYPFVKTDTGTATIYLHDIVLIPIDEFSGEAERSPQSTTQADALNLIDLDGTNQKLYNRAVKRAASDDRIKELWLSRGVLPPSLQANATQRVFFLQRSSATLNPEQSVSWQTLGVQLGKVSRYLGFRGDR